MQINTHLLNLISQILEANVKKRATANTEEWGVHSREVVRLKDAAIAEIQARYPTRYSFGAAEIELNRVLELLSIHEG